MTKGDSGSIKCAACKKAIISPLGGVVQITGIVEFTKKCPHCSVVLRFWARQVVVVDCEKESKVK